MNSKSACAYCDQVTVRAMLSSCATGATRGIAPGLLSAPPFGALLRKAQTLRSASQSSRLYWISLAFHDASPVLSQFLRQTTLSMPEASGSVQRQPRQPATSLRPFEYVGK